jgi:SAM-dependent methyltransferase
MSTRSYARLCSEFYDLDKPRPPPDAFDFYERYARLARGPILEPMCGSGRFLLPLLAQGLDIEGSDTSPSMLEACRARGRALGLSPALSEQAIETLGFSRRFALIFVPSGSFGLLIDDAQVQAALARVYEALLPGGSFLVEAEHLRPAPPETSGAWGGRWVERADGAKLVMSWLSQYSGAPNLTTSLHRYELVKDGQLLETEYEDFRVRSYAPSEFRALLEKAGFHAIEALRPYAPEPTDDSDDASVFCARKPAG